MPAIATQTMHDHLTHDRLTTIYVNEAPTLQVCEQHNGAPITRRFLTRGTVIVTPRLDRLTFDQTVTYWTLFLADQPTPFASLEAATQTA